MPALANVVNLPAPRAYLKRHHGFFRTLITLPFFVVGAFFLISQSPKPSFSSPLTNGYLLLDAPVVVDFSWPVSRNLTFSISPNVEGELSFESDLFKGRLVTRAVFTPDFTWDPQTKYEITFSDVQNPISVLQNPKTYSMSFTTVASSRIVNIKPSQGEVISADEKWYIAFDKPPSRFEEYTFQFEPSISFKAEKSQDGLKYIIQPAQLLAQGQKYVLNIYSANKKQVFGVNEVASQSQALLVGSNSWQVRQPPGVVEVAPTGTNVPLDSSLKLAFTEKIDKQTFISNTIIDPSVSGSWTSDDGSTFSLDPSNLQPGTTYTITVKSGTKTLAKGFLVSDVVYQFTTIGPVKIIQSSPADGAKGVSVGSQLAFSFDQNVDHKSAESNFKILPVIKGSFQWNKDTLIFKAQAPLNFSSNYKVTFSKGIQAPSGFVFALDQVFNFTTEISVTRLAVPFHRQEHKLSCEVATLVMALRYRGVNIDEQPLIDVIGFDPTPKKNGVWGDPNKAFVGDINGDQPGTGYGVYWGPIANAAQKYRSARAFTNGKLTDITSEVTKGNPVIFWGTAGTGRRIDWKTQAGENIVAITGEHTRIVFGFVGSQENPSKIITLDPLYGEKNFTKAAFLQNWALLGNSGVVVE